MTARTLALIAIALWIVTIALLCIPLQISWYRRFDESFGPYWRLHLENVGLQRSKHERKNAPSLLRVEAAREGNPAELEVKCPVE